MAKDGHVSSPINFQKKPMDGADLKVANQAAYNANDVNDKDEKSHGSRPHQINRPEAKKHSVGKARL